MPGGDGKTRLRFSLVANQPTGILISDIEEISLGPRYYMGDEFYIYR